jgi:halimadienyl-diphosphate synthase
MSSLLLKAKKIKRDRIFVSPGRVDSEVNLRLIVESLGGTEVSLSIYDTCMVYYYNGFGSDAILRSSIVDRIKAAQYFDGSWGGGYFYCHDRVVNTLAALVFLVKFDNEDIFVKKGIEFVEFYHKEIINENIDLIGFEFIFLNLLNILWSLGIEIKINKSVLDHIQSKKEKKLSILSGVKITDSESLVLFNLEALNCSIDKKILRRIEENGSVLGSPSATGYYLSLYKNKRSEKFMNESAVNGFYPTIYPIDIFEIVWPIYYLSFFIDSFPQLKELLHEKISYLETCWDNKLGVAHTKFYRVKDSDDSAIVYSVLKKFGRKVSDDFFYHYERDSYFACYPFERNISLISQVRILEASKYIENKDEKKRIKKKCLNCIRMYGLPVYDKWHVSGYYSTSQLLLAYSDKHKVNDLVDWFLHRQKENGSWGEVGGTLEETLFVLIALMARGEPKLIAKNIHIAMNYVYRQERDFVNNRMWVGKTLYSPVSILNFLYFLVDFIYNEYFKD